MNTIPDINTRFALPIVCPTTGEHVSAETLYNRCCAAMGHVVRDHIGDLILDNLDYDSGLHDPDALCAAVYAWSRNVRRLIAGRTARFWDNINGSAVRLTIHKGDEFSHVTGGQTDEGFSYTAHTWSFDGDAVTVSTVVNARDCDGPISHYQTSSCPLADLAEGYVDADEPPFARNGVLLTVQYPRWGELSASQRDASAEAAGY